MKVTIVSLACLISILSLVSVPALCERNDIHHMMYETFKDVAMCFRILNGTNQFGCSTTTAGTTGVVHFVNNESDIEWLLHTSKAGPYMTVIPPKLFTREAMKKLANAPQVSGVLLAVNGTDVSKPNKMSPDDTCPNRYSSLSGSCDDTKPWNPFGHGFLQVDWPISIFVVKDSVILQTIYDCFKKFNLPLEDNQLERPLCSLQMKGHMYAAVDTPTCLRRNSLVNSFSPINFCDPMGDQNIVYHLFPRDKFKTAPNNSVVLVTARLDSATMFDDLAPGAMSTVTGIVTILTTAHLLSQILPEYKDSYKKNVVFALLNGEAQDYIGSSRVVYDMKQGKFPTEDLPIHLEHLDQVIDLHQLDATAIYCHCFKSTTAQSTVDILSKSCKLFGVTINGSCSSDKLPPTSLHSFLKENSSLPGIILTNHASQYKNQYYNGLLDDSFNVDFKYANGSEVSNTSIQSSLASIVHGLTLSLAQIVDKTASWPNNITVQNTASLIDELMHCYLESRQCKIFTNVSGGLLAGEGPLPLYVGVNRSSNKATSLTLYTLSQLTGVPLNTSGQQCNVRCDANNLDQYYSCYWIGGASGVCMATRIVLTPAVSPAFSIENYNWKSGEYSSWTESVWAEVGLRMFLRPPFSQELNSFVSGLVVLLISFASVYWINNNAEQLFNPLVSSLLESQKDTSLLLEQVDPSALYGTCERC